ncbi:CD109 antigen-like [Odontesthes bonariensis]
MGNFSGKDSHGPTAACGESFHTPPSSPQSDGTGFMSSVPKLPSSPAVPASSSSSAPAVTSSGKKSQQSTPVTPSTPIPPPDWRPPPPVTSNSSTAAPGLSSVHKKTGSTVAGRGEASLGRNESPPNSAPRSSVSQVKSVAVSPIKCPSSVSSAPSPTSSLGQNWKERNMGLSQSLPAGHEERDSQGEELVDLLEECRTTLGITASQDGTANTTEMLKFLLTEVKSLKSTLQTEREEWLQFQADLQVAVSVADRLRAEADEELTALRTAHKDIERELAAAQQRQKKADAQLATLREELKESRQRLATLTQAKDQTPAPCQEPERPSGDSKKTERKEGTERGRGRGVYRLGREEEESKNQSDVTQRVVSDDARIDCKSVTKRYLRNVTNEDREGADVRSSETRRMITTERSRSLSRLPASSDSLTLHNGTSQSNFASTLGPTNKNSSQLRGRGNLEWQDSKSSNDTGRREDSLNKYNSALTELPTTKSQDGFNLLLRRHGGSKRNSLLRWCQSRTQGYKNIDITNFSSSWADGLAFCAVYHTYLPSHIPYSTLSPENKRDNLSLAFKTGETVGIAQSLTVEEMLRAGGPDWQRVLSYVESMYRHFEIMDTRDKMNRIWTLVGFCVVSVSAQTSSNTTLFLISGPEVVHAGTTTPLAITVFDDFPGQVTAELTHGNTKVAQTANFQGGLTRVLTLPPIPGSISQNSLLNLTVRAYKTGSLIFSNTTTLAFNLRNVTSFIQTDKSRYKPGDTVLIRVVSVQLDNLPYKGRLDISLRDPSGSIVDRWVSTGNLGIVLQDFTLTQMSPLGRWEITATVNGVTDEKAFIVEHIGNISTNLLLHFQPFFFFFKWIWKIHGPQRMTQMIFFLYSHKADDIYGSTQFLFSKEQIQALTFPSDFSSNGHIAVHIAACVNDSSTGFKVNKTVEVNLMQNTYQMMFLDYPPSLKPSLHFSAKLKITRYDRKPLSLLELTHSAVVEVTQGVSLNDMEATTLTFPVPEDGNVHIKFKLQDQIVMLFVQARFQSSEETLRVYTNYSSPSGSYIQLSPVNTLPAQVSSKGQVVAAGTKNSSSLSLTPALSWSPKASVTVYCILSNGEVTTDTAHIPIHQHNHVTLNWSSERAKPGEQVSLTVAAPESRFQVGIMVMGTHDDDPQSDLDFKVEQVFNLKMLTNTGLYTENQKNGPKNGENLPEKRGDYLIVEKYLSHWMDTSESLLWFDTNVSDKIWTSGKITVPDGVMSLRAVALVMSENLGLGFTPVPQKLTVSKDFSLSLDVPPHLIRGEEIVLEVNVINHLEQDIEVIVIIAQSEAFKFVMMDRGDGSVINAKKLSLKRHMSASALFPIRSLALGEMEISVDAVSKKATGGLVRRVMVKPEGVEQSFSQTVFLELAPEKLNNTRSVSFSFPPHVVPGSQRAYVALGGDILAMSINNLDSLVQMPTGCGEQNMIHFAPSVYVLQYLDKSTQDDKEIRSKALEYLTKGYQKQLSYQRDDGSFSAFGSSDTSGSTWLTAFVLRCFIQAQPYMQVNQTLLTRAMTWLLKHQRPQGDFIEGGRLIHTEMQGGLDDGPVALTAYVLLAFLEDDTYAEMHEDNVSQALRYLESKVSSGVVSNYSLCLVAYALALGNSPVAGKALTELIKRADYTDGVMMWTSSAGLRSHDWQPHSTQIEMASYVLLALFKRGSFIEGIALMKWLCTQRNHLGSFRTTQDTVVALQALAYYAAFSGANAIDLRLNISAPTSSFVSLFQINSTNYRIYQSQEINADKDLPLNIYTEGRGFAIFQVKLNNIYQFFCAFKMCTFEQFAETKSANIQIECKKTVDFSSLSHLNNLHDFIQLNVFYNVESEASSQNLEQASDGETFLLKVDLTVDSDSSHMTLSVCTSLKENQAVAHTGMVILDVSILSGFSLFPGVAVQANFIKKVERTPEKVILYLDSLTKTEVCIQLPMVRHYKVASVKDAMVQVYDYYEPTRKATRSYNSDILRNTDSCFFCGEYCALCWPGITITVNPPLLSKTVSGATFSLSCLFLGVTAFLFLV